MYLRNLLRRLRPAGDQGLTLVELLVAMFVFSLFMGLVTSEVVRESKTTIRTQSVNDAVFQLDRIFFKLDHQVRYADAINPPGQSSGDWYVEFETSASGSTFCDQWRLDVASSRVQTRSWTVTTGTITPPAWISVATGITTDGSNAPFTFTAANSTYAHQRLSIDLRGQDSAVVAVPSLLKVAFDATNTTTSTSTNTAGNSVCTQVPRS